MKKIGIVEDEPEFALWLKAVLAGIEGYDCVFAANSLAQAYEQLATHPVDVLLVDLGLPDGNGADLILKVFKKYPDTRCCVLSSMDDGEVIFNAFFQGADGFLIKTTEKTLLLGELKTTLEGGFANSAPFHQRVLAFAKKTAQFRALLSDREMEIIQLLARGYSQKEVAATLDVQACTVNSHQKSIYTKLHVNSLAGATKVLSL